MKRWAKAPVAQDIIKANNLKRAPFEDTEIEIRQVFEAEDFGDNLTPEVREQEERLRAQVAAKQ